MRYVVLHYHLFKNAGTSLDQILRDNFQHLWVTREFAVEAPNNTHRVRQWIIDTPGAIAFSSHTMIGPPPQIDGVRIVPIILLRDPIARIASAYRFERRQRADTRGAQLAKAHSFEGYVSTRLATPGDRQCRNFQTARLASMVPGDASEKERAFQACLLMQETGVLGLVAQFDATVATLKREIVHAFPDFSTKTVRANVSAAAAAEPLTEHMRSTLIMANADDLALLKHVQAQLQTV